MSALGPWWRRGFHHSNGIPANEEVAARNAQVRALSIRINQLRKTQFQQKSRPATEVAAEIEDLEAQIRALGGMPRVGPASGPAGPPASHAESARSIREKEAELERLKRLKLHYSLRHDGANADLVNVQVEALSAEINAERAARWPTSY